MTVNTLLYVEIMKPAKNNTCSADDTLLHNSLQNYQVILNKTISSVLRENVYGYHIQIFDLTMLTETERQRHS